ncbi:hypothetical protein BH23PSE2_BH23PSE2_08150 [soil metagenome]
MPLQRRQTGESVADDLDVEMPAAIPGTGVAGMAVAIVAHLEPAWRERLLQGRADRIDALFARQWSARRFGVHGNTGRNGRTSTRA